MAVLVYENKDLNGIEELMDLETRLSREALRRAAAILGAKNPDNPKRSMAYLLGGGRKADLLDDEHEKGEEKE